MKFWMGFGIGLALGAVAFCAFVMWLVSAPDEPYN